MTNIKKSVMGWYAPVYNYTKNQFSRSEFKNGEATLAQILKYNPEWSKTDVIVGGGLGMGMGGGYFLINGFDRFRIINHWQDDIVIDYDIEPIDEITECECGTLYTHGGIVLGPHDQELMHCQSCHRVWDGNAQCPCWLDS